MDKKVAGLASALAVTAIASAQAAVPAKQPSRAMAYAELVKPIANAVAELKAADAAARENASRSQTGQNLQLAQYWGDGYYYHHHHHHHHHHDYYWRRRWHHHHHHHHDYYPRPRWHHHHHWWDE